jgi:ABC-type nitrate/sulfonate/bicarbonate transport system substrate-binding protein
MKLRKILILFSILIVTIILTFHFSNRNRESSIENNLKIGILLHESSLPFYVAEELNLFTKYKVTVQLVELPPGDHMPALLSDRVALISPTSFTTLFGVMENNPNLLYGIFPGAEVLDYQTVYGIIVKSGFDGTNIYSLKNKRIIAINPFTKVNIENILTAAEISKKDWPKISIASRDAALGAIISDDAESAILDQPSLAIALKTGRFKLLESNPRAKYIGSPYWSGSGAIKIEKWRENEDDVLRVIKAIDEAIIFIRNNKDEAHLILAKRLGIDKSVANEMGGYFFPLSTDTINIVGIEKTVQSLVKANLLKKEVDLSNFFPGKLYNATWK